MQRISIHALRMEGGVREEVKMKVDMQLLKAKLKYRKRTYAEVAAAIGMNRDTFARRLQREDFSVKNVHGLMEAVPLTMEEVQEIFFVKEKDAD